MSPWPYPFWIAHRGAGKLAPENTLAALQIGARHGFGMFECDVQLSADGVPFLLHDATLQRTTTGAGAASQQPWSALAPLDAGGWHSRDFAGTSIPTLESVARWCLANGHHLNIEIKPPPGQETRTGHAIAVAVARLWPSSAVPPLLTSFAPAALQAACQAAPHLPRGLLLDQWADGWENTAQHLGCVAIVAHHPLWSVASMAAVKTLGLRSLSYTVNDETTAQRLIGLGVDGLITDEVASLGPAAR
jgi:glycerophosphoryl diester phosphodiesterase